MHWLPGSSLQTAHIPYGTKAAWFVVPAANAPGGAASDTAITLALTKQMECCSLACYISLQSLGMMLATITNTAGLKLSVFGQKRSSPFLKLGLRKAYLHTLRPSFAREHQK